MKKMKLTDGKTIRAFNRQARASDMLKLVRAGKTYEEVGSLYGLSKQRINAILKSEYPNELKEAMANRSYFIGERKPARKVITINCAVCGIEIETESRYYARKYCSVICRRVGMSRERAKTEKRKKLEREKGKKYD